MSIQKQIGWSPEDNLLADISKQFDRLIQVASVIAGGGGGTVTSFSSTNLSPLFTTSVTNPTTTPALSFSLSNAGANTWFGNNTGGSTAPAYNNAGSLTEVTSAILTIVGSNTLLANTTIQVLQSSGSQSGYLSSTDWNTFNNKVSTARTLTINGSAQDLSANRTWTITTTGTSNRITVTGGAGVTPTVDIAATYIGQTSITTLGTITSGTWNATIIGALYGGTGVDSSTWSQGDIPFISTTGVWNHLAKNTTATRYLSNTGATNNPAWAQVDLTNGVIGILPIANGGTGSSVGAWLLSGTSALSGNATINGAFQVLFQNTQSANGAITTRFNPTITATANNDNLNAVEIDATFTNGAFTGVVDSILRLKSSGSILYNYRTNAASLLGDVDGNYSITLGSSTVATSVGIKASSAPLLYFSDMGQGSNLKHWSFFTQTGIIKWRTLNDAFATVATPFQLSRTGDYTLTQSAESSAWAPLLISTPGAHTALTTNIAFISRDFQGATWTWVDGTVGTQIFNNFGAYTANKTTTSATFTDIYNSFFFKSIAGATVTFTRNWGIGTDGNLQVQGKSFLGAASILPTALLHLAAGTASANTAPLKLTSGTNLTTAETGAFEYDGINLFFTPSGTTRKTASLYQLGRSTAQTGANANVAQWTVGANDGTFVVSANVLVTTSTTHAFTVTCTYTDEGNTSRTITLNFSQLAGTFVTSIANTGGTVPYEGVPLQIRCKTATTITIGTTGTFTSVTYNIEGAIAQIN